MSTANTGKLKPMARLKVFRPKSRNILSVSFANSSNQTKSRSLNTQQGVAEGRVSKFVRSEMDAMLRKVMKAEKSVMDPCEMGRSDTPLLMVTSSRNAAPQAGRSENVSKTGLSSACTKSSSGLDELMEVY